MRTRAQPRARSPRVRARILVREKSERMERMRKAEANAPGGDGMRKRGVPAYPRPGDASAMCRERSTGRAQRADAAHGGRMGLFPGFILLALLASFLIGVADYVYGRAVRNRISPGTMTVSQASFVVPATWLWAHMEGAYAWTGPAFLGIAAALFTFTGFWSFMKSAHLGEASVSTPIYRMGFVVTAAAAICFLGESVTMRKIIGFLLTGCAIFLFSDFRLAGFSAERRASILWAVAAMASVGLVNFIYKLGVSGGVAPTMFLHSQSVFFIAIALAYASMTQGGPRFSRKGWAHALITGACFTFGNVALLAALRDGEATIVTPIAQLSFIVSAFLAVWRLSEKMTIRKFLGLAAAAGTILAFIP